MRRFVWVWMGLGILVTALGYSGIHAQKRENPGHEAQTPKAMGAALPSSLDALYPPKAEQPIFLFKKLGMATSFSGIVSDLMENDPENAQANFAAFKAQYAEFPELVPEWKGDFPPGPVEELGAALAGGDQGKIMAAYEKVGGVCHHCHAANMPKVQHRYEWPDFYSIRVTDPLTGEEVSFSQLKQYLQTNFGGIIVNVEQGQRENAQRQLEGFNARFQALKEICLNCHQAEPEYYVDDGVQALVDDIKQALGETSFDPKKVEAMTQGIGNESCHKCHLVHSPAALSKQ
jgi:cytochrome c556